MVARRTTHFPKNSAGAAFSPDGSSRPALGFQVMLSRKAAPGVLGRPGCTARLTLSQPAHGGEVGTVRWSKVGA